MEISHSHAKLICAYDGVSGVNLRFYLLQLWLLLPFVLPFSHSSILASFYGLVRRFTSLYVRHLLQIVVLSLQPLALSEQSPRLRIKEPHE
jgi:hypothetical protein